MAIEFEKSELRELVIDSYNLMLSIKGLNKKYEIQSRSKLKNLPEALREFEDPTASVVHFVKSAAYFLPRSDAKLNAYLDKLLEIVQKIQNSDGNPERIKEKIRYLIGYSNWSMDSVLFICKNGNSDVDIEKRLKNMIGSELQIVGAQDDTDMLVKRIMDWKNGGK